MFYSLERPVELVVKEQTIDDLEYEQQYLLMNAMKLVSYYEGSFGFL
ncbi:unnamed protein product [Toxocara canis]|uniref:Uncharacterized protein n=1 Tax=Toxocara canis TaxID=6265 RepID=A0A3P7FEL3_TOXCA|nr:unnamed protein product [Toxocara canis]